MDIRLTRLRQFLCLICAALLALQLPTAFAQEIHVSGPGAIKHLAKRSEGVLYFSRDLFAGCGGDEFTFPCQIESVSTFASSLSSPPVVMFQDTMNINAHVYSQNIAVNADGRFSWLGNSAVLTGAAAATVALRTPIGSLTDEVAVDDDYFFWTEGSKIYRRSHDVADTMLLVDAGQDVDQLQADGRGGVYYIGLLRQLRNTSPNPVTGTIETTAGPVAVLRYTVDDDYIYAVAVTSGAGDYTLHRSPSTNLAAYVAGTSIGSQAAGDTELSALAVSQTKLYWYKRGTSSDARVIHRMPKESWNVVPAPSVSITPIIPQPVTDMTVANFWLFYLSDNKIWRLNLATAPISADLGIDQVVVNQGVSGLDEFILIKDKPGIVWVEPRVDALTGIDQVTARIKLERRDQSGGLVQPVLERAVTLDGTPVNRNVPETLVLFDLPASWMSGGGRIDASIHPVGVAGAVGTEQTFLPAEGFRPKANACVKFVPIWTTDQDVYSVYERGLSGSLTPGFLDILRRAESIYPVPELRFYTQANPMRRTETGSFDMRIRRPQNDIPGSAALLGQLFWHNIFDQAPDHCGGNNARTFYSALVPPAVDTRLSSGGQRLGTGSFGEPFSWTKMLSTGEGFSSGLAGSVMIHEFGHNTNELTGLNENWQHVGCGLPTGADFNSNYPYDYCTIGLQPDSVDDNDGQGSIVLFEAWGFDPISGETIEVRDASDYMSYRAASWASYYRWQELMGKIEDQPESTGYRPAAADMVSDVFVISGVLDPTETFVEVLNSAFVTEDILVPLTNSKSTPLCGTTHTYDLVYYDDAQSELDRAELGMSCSGDDHDSGHIFFHTLAVPPGTALLSIENELGQSFWDQPAFGEEPIIEIIEPQSGWTVENDLPIAWFAEAPSGLPLTFTVQFRENEGVGWRVLATSLEAPEFYLDDLSQFPGSENGLQLRVIASDGFNTSQAVVGDLVSPNNAPVAAILYPLDGAAFEVNEGVNLIGRGFDTEEGSLSGEKLSWSLSGPTNVSATGKNVQINDLPPGSYTLTLSAEDDNGASSSTTNSFVIEDKFVPTSLEQPLLDGVCDDEAYTFDTDVIGLRYANSDSAVIRFARSGDWLYVCASSLVLDSVDNDSRILLYLDRDDSADVTPQAGDLQLRLGQNGVLTTQNGSAGSWNTQSSFLPHEAFTTRPDPGSWTAELRINMLHLSGGWSTFSRVAVEHIGVTGSDVAAWPVGVDSTWPATWGRFALTGGLAQTISFAAIPDTPLTDAYVSANAAATSGLPVTVTSLTPAVCDVDTSRNVLLYASGTCALEASQSGSSVYLPATPVSRSFSVLGDQITDTDADGEPDATDNCTIVSNPDQIDTNGDGFGNACDADLNNDNIVNVVDLGLLRSAFFNTGAQDADFNSDGVVNVVDLGIMRSYFFQPPGPAAGTL